MQMETICSSWRRADDKLSRAASDSNYSAQPVNAVADAGHRFHGSERLNGLMYTGWPEKNKRRHRIIITVFKIHQRIIKYECKRSTEILVY